MTPPPPSGGTAAAVDVEVVGVAVVAGGVADIQPICGLVDCIRSINTVSFVVVVAAGIDYCCMVVVGLGILAVSLVVDMVVAAADIFLVVDYLDVLMARFAAVPCKQG
jgi:hypothetical protein